MGKDEKGESLSYDPSWIGVNLDRGFRGDSFVGIIFLAFLGASIGIGIYAFAHGDPNILRHISTVVNEGKDVVDATWIQHAMRHVEEAKWIIIGSAFGTLVLAAVWLALLRYFCRLIIYMSVILGIAGMVVGAIVLLGYAFKHQQTTLEVLGFIGLGVAVVAALLVFCLRKKIDFTATLIEEGCSGLFHNITLFTVVAPIIFVLLVGYCIFWGAALVYLACIPKADAPTIKYLLEPSPRYPDGLRLETPAIDHNKEWFILYMVFSLFWFLALKSAVMWATYAGAVAQWYFGRSGLAVSGVPAFTSLRFALTYNLGSLSFGSLIIAMLDFINFLLNRAEKQSPNRCVGCVFRAIQCCCCCIRSIVEYINSYAYIYIAMHGYSFPKAAKEVMNLLSRCGLDRIIADTITTWVIWFGNIFCAAVMVTIHILIQMKDKDGVNGWALVFTAGIAIVVFYFVSVSIRIAADTVFVCYAEDTERNSSSRDYQYTEGLHDAIQQRQNVLKPEV